MSARSIALAAVAVLALVASGCGGSNSSSGSSGGSSSSVTARVSSAKGKIEKGEIDPSFVITHKLKLEDAPGAYKVFRDKLDGCIKVVLKP